jgi:hypothetical protein
MMREQSTNLGERRKSRAAVLRRREQTRSWSANDDEVGGEPSAMREQSTKEKGSTPCS